MAEKKRYIATEKCFHEGTLYRKGDVLKGDTPPMRNIKDADGKIVEQTIAHFVESGTYTESPPVGKPVKVNKKDTVAQ